MPDSQFGVISAHVGALGTNRNGNEQQCSVIDLFAGPGGLSEGFSSYRADKYKPFRIALSIEKDVWAHQTLELRVFFRQFGSHVPDDYYRLLRAEIGRDELFRRHPAERDTVMAEARRAELGSEDLSEAVLDSVLNSVFVCA